MAEKYLGESIPKLGFGFMRLPRLADGSFDKEQIDRMVDTYLENGFTYFDTAFVYQGSEEAMRESLIKRHPREKYQVASKLNLMFAKSREGMQEQFETTMTRLGTDYLDFYLIHGLGAHSIGLADELDAWGFVKELKEQGKIRHFGFSFHGNPEEFEGILSKHPDAEFAQIQLNYLDWDSNDVYSHTLYDIAQKYKIPLTIMEPLKGGKLASETMPGSDDFRKADPNASVASWALRFVADLDGLVTILSGMSTYEQLADNVATFKALKPLNDDDRALIAKVAEVIRATPGIPCTGCRYCVEECPQKINIPALMDLYSQYLVYKTADNLGHAYGFMTANGGKAKDCISCKICQGHCPQHIEIADTLALLSPLVDK